MTTLHARIKADGSHAIVEMAEGVPQIDGNGANLIEDDGDTAWFVWDDFEIVSPEDRLEYLRGEIEAERIGTAELIELEGLAEFIDPADVLLLQWAGVPEFGEDEN